MCFNQPVNLRSSQRIRQRAFSLVEIMVVLVIIGMLAAAITVGTRHYLVSARQNTARTEIAAIVQALETFYISYHRYPTSDEGLDILTRSSERISEALLSQAPTDPWGNAYVYVIPGQDRAFEVMSLGADGREGGDGGDADIRSSNLKQNQ